MDLLNEPKTGSDFQHKLIGSASMIRSTKPRLRLVLVEAIPIALVLFVVGDRYAGQHDLDTPGLFVWRNVYDKSSPSPYFTGLWLEIAVNAFCCLILVFLALWGVHALVRTLRTKRGRSS
jgi:hypothetical protein